MLDQEHQMNQYVLRYWVYNHQLVWLLLFSSGMLRRSLTHQETVRLTLYEVISLSLSHSLPYYLLGIAQYLQF